MRSGNYRIKCGFLQLFLLFTMLTSTVKADEICIALSNGSEIFYGSLTQENTLILKNKLMQGKLTGASWPAYSKKNGELIFEAKERGVQGIYSTDVSKNIDNIRLLANGRLPALSPGGEYLAYISSKGELHVQHLETKITHTVLGATKKPSIWEKVIWVGDDSFIFIGVAGDLYRYYVDSKNSVKVSSASGYPVQSNSKHLIIIDENATEVTSYDYMSAQTISIYKNKFLSLGPSILLISERNGMIFSQQTWRKVLSFSEEKALFFFDARSGKKKMLAEKFTFFGGAVLPCEL